MAFKHVRTDDPSTPTNDTRTRLLEKVLVRHAAEGFDVLELRRQMGKAGYVPTEHKWEDDGAGDDLTDEDGSVLLIGGMPPGDLAAEIVEAARQHVDETNDRKNYRVVALRHVEGDNGDEEEVEVFRFLLPATMFGGGMPDPATGSDARENHDALMAANQQLQRQNELLFRMLMEVVRQYPTMLHKCTELLEQLGDQLGGGRQQDLQQVLSILELEMTREQRWMDHDRAKQRTGHRADIFGKSLEIAGPDLMALLRKIIEMATTQQGQADAGAGAADATSSSPSSASASTTPPPPQSGPTIVRFSRYARTLDQALAGVPAGGIAKARKLLSEDDWKLIEAARKAADDDEFAAIFTKLNESWTAKGEAATKELMAKLVGAIGVEPAMVIGKLIKDVQGR